MSRCTKGYCTLEDFKFEFKEISKGLFVVSNYKEYRNELANARHYFCTPTQNMKNKKKAIREDFRTVCLARDRYRCRTCNLVAEPSFDRECPELDVHHITDRTKMPKGGYVLENGISLCHKCHTDAEKFHSTGGEEWVHGMHPSDLYKMIGSSYEKAVEASERL